MTSANRWRSNRQIPRSSARSTTAPNISNTVKHADRMKTRKRSAGLCYIAAKADMPVAILCRQRVLTVTDSRSASVAETGNHQRTLQNTLNTIRNHWRMVSSGPGIA